MRHAMTRLLAVPTVLSFMIIASSAQQEQSDEQLTKQRFENHIDHIREELPKAWREDWKQYILDAYPNTDRSVLNNIDIVANDDYCDIQPRTLTNGEKYTIEFGEPALTAFFISSQPMFSYMIGEVYFSLEELQDFYIKEAHRTVNLTRKVCANANRRKNSQEFKNVLMQSMPIWLSMDSTAYYAMQNHLYNDEESRRMGDLFGIGILFVVMHEAGHVLGARTEIEADTFAKTVLDRQGLSSSFAVPYLAQNEGFSCRVQKIININDTRSMLIRLGMENYVENSVRFLHDARTASFRACPG